MLATLESVMHVFQERIFEPSSCAWLRARLPGLNPAPDPIRLLAANSQIRNPIRLLASNPIGNPIGNIYIYMYIYILGGPPRPQALGEDVGVGFVVFEKMTSLIFSTDF